LIFACPRFARQTRGAKHVNLGQTLPAGRLPGFSNTAGTARRCRHAMSVNMQGTLADSGKTRFSNFFPNLLRTLFSSN
jgi:hypothetical protein